MVLAVMEAQGLFRDMGRKSALRIRQGGELERHDISSWSGAWFEDSIAGGPS
jgi:hypothetical protein